MTRHVILMALATAACGSRTTTTTPPPQDRFAALVGTEHPPRPAGITEVASYLLDESSRGRWVVAEVKAARDPARAVILDEVISRGAAGATRWRTAAVQPVRAADSALTVALGTCSVAGRADRWIVGLTTSAAKPLVRRAWRVDTATRRFTSVDAAKVTCDDLMGR
ncbi:MAG: hypothetical protein H0W15_02020 [Gemmatimonadales bacterium]|nr:hypothetical protein [Gemmatimonadales bacterium]